MSKVPSVALSHVGVYVRDLDRMERFYTGFLGFIVTDRGNLGAIRLVFLSRDPCEHLVDRPAPRDSRCGFSA